MKKTLFLLLLLNILNTYTTDAHPTADTQKPPFALTLPPTPRGSLVARRLSMTTAMPSSQGLQARRAAEEAKRAAEKIKYLRRITAELNLLLQEIGRYNGTDLLPKNIPLAYYRYDDGTAYPQIDFSIFSTLNYQQQEEIIKNITVTHNTALNTLPKKPKVRWADDNDQALEDVCPTDQFPSEAMFEMHGYPVPFGTKNSKSTARAGQRTFWYENYDLSPDTKRTYMEREGERRFATPQDGEEEQEVLRRMEAEGTRTSREWRSQDPYYKIEQLKRMYPEIFKK